MVALEDEEEGAGEADCEAVWEDDCEAVTSDAEATADPLGDALPLAFLPHALANTMNSMTTGNIQFRFVCNSRTSTTYMIMIIVINIKRTCVRRQSLFLNEFTIFCESSEFGPYFAGCPLCRDLAGCRALHTFVSLLPVVISPPHQKKRDEAEGIRFNPYLKCRIALRPHLDRRNGGPGSFPVFLFVQCG
ncbi:hypothetical protein OMP38_07055 [Cohnella ginsengisoli]|uniref:Uncharacterized protein n=1 Tax=Cohnella ginsengisoli TaxID=425004 RepID=A0A9X4QLD1_9BACL|nr:hypothetical protein [Cohnella ginsengisoli]MDG0790639.1 hypothetical protein [Cohnella ginsengisoli]